MQVLVFRHSRVEPGEVSVLGEIGVPAKSVVVYRSEQVRIGSSRAQALPSHGDPRLTTLRWEGMINDFESWPSALECFRIAAGSCKIRSVPRECLGWRLIIYLYPTPQERTVAFRGAVNPQRLGSESGYLTQYTARLLGPQHSGQ
jgi:hypothetical protein